MHLWTKKSSLYQLVASFTELPPRLKTHFWEAPQHTAYFLGWDLGRSKAILEINSGEPTLRVKTPVIDNIHHISIQDLRDRGMIKDRTAN